MTDRELLQQALEALELHAKQYPHMHKGYTVDAITALRERLAPEEPVALETVYDTIIHWDETDGKRSRRELARRIIALYTTPPRREWVGLEQSDMPDGDDPIYDDPRFIAGIVWAAKKLLEKNT